MQRQQQVIDQHLASLSEQDRQTFSQLSYIENYHYLVRHNLLEHDTESESELSVSDSESNSKSGSESGSESDSEDYLPDLCDSNAKCETDGWDIFPSKASNGANEVCIMYIQYPFLSAIAPGRF